MVRGFRPCRESFQRQQRSGSGSRARERARRVRLKQAMQSGDGYGESLRKSQVLEAPALFARGTDLRFRCGCGSSGQERKALTAHGTLLVVRRVFADPGDGAVAGGGSCGGASDEIRSGTPGGAIGDGLLTRAKPKKLTMQKAPLSGRFCFGRYGEGRGNQNAPLRMNAGISRFSLASSTKAGWGMAASSV